MTKLKNVLNETSAKTSEWPFVDSRLRPDLKKCCVRKEEWNREWGTFSKSLFGYKYGFHTNFRHSFNSKEPDLPVDFKALKDFPRSSKSPTSYFGLLLLDDIESLSSEIQFELQKLQNEARKKYEEQNLSNPLEILPLLLSTLTEQTPTSQMKIYETIIQSFINLFSQLQKKTEKIEKDISESEAPSRKKSKQETLSKRKRQKEIEINTKEKSDFENESNVLSCKFSNIQGEEESTSNNSQEEEAEIKKKKTNPTQKNNQKKESQTDNSLSYNIFSFPFNSQFKDETSVINSKVSKQERENVQKKSLKNSGLYPTDVDVKPSTIQDVGNGLFAKRTFQKNEHVSEFVGELFSKEGAKEVSKQQNQNFKAIRGSGLIIAGITQPIENSGAASFAKDPKDPKKVNTKWYTDTTFNKIYLKATRTIEPNEEIFVSYGKAFWRRQKCADDQSE